VRLAGQGSEERMMNGLLFALVVLSALGCGLMAGLFFAFSVAIMAALARLPPAAGIAAMQSINAVILNSLFRAVFFGTAALCALAVLSPLWTWGDPGAPWRLLGGALYLAGGLLVTMACNVPLNQALAALAPDDPGSTERWREYVARWTAWNHVRTLACLAAAASLTAGLWYQARGLGAG
jgi:uncharacterized membrane protein